MGQKIKPYSLIGKLRFDEWDLPEDVNVVLHKEFSGWLVGLPVLKYFHLLLPHELMLTADEIRR